MQKVTREIATSKQRQLECQQIIEELKGAVVGAAASKRIVLLEEARFAAMREIANAHLMKHLKHLYAAEDTWKGHVTEAEGMIVALKPIVATADGYENARRQETFTAAQRLLNLKREIAHVQSKLQVMQDAHKAAVHQQAGLEGEVEKERLLLVAAQRRYASLVQVATKIHEEGAEIKLRLGVRA